MTVAALAAAPALARGDDVSEQRMRAHEAFLAGPALHGRASASTDEATAAAYVAAQFLGYGLLPPPGASDYLQTAPLVRQQLAGPPELAVDGQLAPGVTLLRGAGGETGGAVALLRPGAPPKGKAGALVVLDPKAEQRDILKVAHDIGARLLLLPESDMTRRSYEASGGRPRLPIRFASDAPAEPGMTIAAYPAALLPALGRSGATAVLSVPVTIERTVTTSAIAYLPGSDPSAKLLLLSAHLDHLGRGLDGRTWYGANDDASGVTALLEIARLLAAGKRPRCGILFVGYGAEELGGFGSRWFGAHPPVPLDRLAANLEFEMLGEQENKLPPLTLMMTGYERSDFGATLKAHGARIAPDPYPGQPYFERSDNYSLALVGVVAHTVSGRAEATTYHRPTDTPDKIDYRFMRTAVRSLVGPIRWLAASKYEPRWNPGGRPVDR